jgi:hypothetical protein
MDLNAFIARGRVIYANHSVRQKAIIIIEKVVAEANLHGIFGPDITWVNLLKDETQKDLQAAGLVIVTLAVYFKDSNPDVSNALLEALKFEIQNQTE